MTQVVVLTGYGINCAEETANAFKIAGGNVILVHLNDLVDNPDILKYSKIFAIPGGFSFGDHVSAGRILANRLKYTLQEPIQEFIQAGKLVIGICNGFQVLVKAGILPMFSGSWGQTVSLSHNNSNRFENRWVKIQVRPNTKCVWLKGLKSLELPVRHGEGKIIASNQATIHHLIKTGEVSLEYSNPQDEKANGYYPDNPNGSTLDVAGMCDPSGRIFGLMPHPEAFTDYTNHPCWTRQDTKGKGQGLSIFVNGVEFASSNL